MYRIGTGYDLHRLVDGRPLILGGVNIEYHRGLEGHSDADVLVHALMDALLGAAGLKDIGHHFPPHDPEFKGASSLQLLKKVRYLVEKKGFQLVNADMVIIAEAPKLAPYLEGMIENITTALAAAPGSITVKATTTEGMGTCGRGEAIAAQAAALLKGSAGLERHR